MSFALFLMVNAALFIRPSEIIPELAEVPVYQALILLTLVIASPKVAGQVSGRSLVERPITACVLGLLVAVVLSHLSRLDTWYARYCGMDFSKVVFYYLLLIAVVDTPARLRGLILGLTGLIVFMTTLALMQYHGYIDLPALAPLDRDDIRQLRGTGIFNDPNDLSLILVTGMICSAWLGLDRGSGLLRLAGPPMLFLLGYALLLTHSRGGFLALLGASLSLAVAHFGRKKSIPVVAMILPVMFVIFDGRQTRISTGEDTAQQRMQFWSEGFVLLRQAPAFGIGMGNFEEEIHHVAHNSYVHAFTELGLFGGSLFVGVFYLALRASRRLDPVESAADPGVLRLRPFLRAIVVSYAVGLFSLSRDYIEPTYLVPGLSVAYHRLAVALPTDRDPRLGLGLAVRIGGLGVVTLIALYLFTRAFVRWG